MRILIANEERDGLLLLTGLVEQLGHEVVASEVDVRAIAEATERAQPDVALVELGPSSEQALGIISEIVREAFCPVIAVLMADDPAFVSEAAKRGIFAYVVDSTPDELQSAIDITLQRFGEYHNLQGAFGRRATIEQAKGILMARQLVSAERAFELLREHSQRSGLKMSDVANGVIASHRLLAHERKADDQPPP
jgi:response regulator NasT